MNPRPCLTNAVITKEICKRKQYVEGSEIFPNRVQQPANKSAASVAFPDYAEIRGRDQVGLQFHLQAQPPKNQPASKMRVWRFAIREDTFLYFRVQKGVGGGTLGKYAQKLKKINNV